MSGKRWKEERGAGGEIMGWECVGKKPVPGTGGEVN